MHAEWQTTLAGKSWLVRFRAFQHELSELLRSADKKVIRERFAALKAGIGDDAGLPETIYCYYSLVAVLQGFMQESGLDGFEKLSYVFGTIWPQYWIGYACGSARPQTWPRSA